VLTSHEDDQRVAATMRSGEILADQLRWHGMQASACAIKDTGQSPAQAIIEAALAAEATLLVMGAYGHSRARELIFGGVTRHVLEGAKIPVLLSH